MVRRQFWFLCSFLFLCTAAFSQCYDLRSTQLFEPIGRFQEWWDKPLWGGQSGNENFHIDESSWGGALHFAIFEVGIIRKAPQGWVPYRAVRQHDAWCDPTPERSGVLCYSTHYQKIPPQAKIHTITDGGEIWSVDSDGIVHYRFHDDRGVPAKVENGSTYKLLPHEFGLDGKDETDATLDLSTGKYKFESHQYLNGAYPRRYPGTGVKLWRIDTFQAKAKLQEIECPTSMQNVNFTDESKEPLPVEMKSPPVCVATIKETKKDGDVVVPIAWDFIQNPQEVLSPEGCIKVVESPFPSDSPPITLTQRQSK